MQSNRQPIAPMARGVRRAQRGAQQPQQFESLEERALFASATGLTGFYFQGTNFRDPITSRVDSVVDFDRLAAPGVSAGGLKAGHGASVRWTGQLKTTSTDRYYFYTQSGGNVRLWIDGKLIIDGENDDGDSLEQRASVILKGRQAYSIKLEYTDGDVAGAGDIKLLWSNPRTAKQVIPTENLMPDARAPFKMRVSFRDDSSDPPQYYKLDDGSVFHKHRLGYWYGWDVDNSANMFDRNSTLSWSERYDGGVLLQASGENRTWHAMVPNGTYRVRVVAGDAEYVDPDTYYAIDVNGKRVIRGKPTDTTHWYDGTVTVTVNNGDIAITSSDRAVGNRINFVEITPANPDVDRIVSAHGIGFFGGDPNARYVSPQQFEGGWQGYVDNIIKPEIKLGIRRFILSNPFGIDPYDKGMKLDQYLDAKEEGMTWLTDGFVEAFKPLVAQGIEFIGYLGQNDESFGTTKESWFARFWPAVKPILDAKMSIAFDGAVVYDEHSNLYEAAQILQSRDVKVYVEARPELANPCWNNYRVISMESWWQFSTPEANPNAASWSAASEDLTGEVIRWLNMPVANETWDTTGWVAPNAMRIIKEGDYAAIPAIKLMDGKDVDWLMAQLNGYQGAKLLK